jgi:YD repeat-containing protein
VALGDGSRNLFRRDAPTGPWIAENRIDELTGDPSQYVYYRASDESRWVFAAGRLSSITQRNGWTKFLSYDAQGQLSSVTNAFGRRLQFAWNAQRLASITTADGNVISYGYDAMSRLVSVRQPDGATAGYAWENPQFPTALTGITDESGSRIATHP